MICVSIGRGRHRHMIAEHQHLVEQGAELVELRVDYINGDVNLKRLLADKVGPVIITCRRQQDGGKWAGSEEARLMLLRTAIAEGVDYVDMEEDIANQIPRFGKTKRIVSLHDFTKTPENLTEIHQRLAALDADVVKIATMANTPHDNLRMLQLMQNADTPTVALCMGEMGTPSRILAGKFGAPFAYSTFHHERALAPGQLSFAEMTEIYQFESINAETEVYGVIADPIGHTLGPIIHNAAFRHLEMNRVYVPFRVPREELTQFLEDARPLGIKGISVTIPHKETIIPLLSKIDGAVRGILACNTVTVEPYAMVGYNTDFRAAMSCIDRAVNVSSSEAPLDDKTAMVLGAGGVAKAVTFGLKRRGAEIIISSRTPERAEGLAHLFECRSVPWNNRHSIIPDILVNGTPVGMHPNVDESPFDKHHLRPSTVVFDTVYNPEQTLLIKEARERGCMAITGVEMFVRQAGNQFELFTGETAPMDIMRGALKRSTGAVKH